MKKRRYVYGIYPKFGNIDGDPYFFSEWAKALDCYRSSKVLDGCTGASIEKSKSCAGLTGKEDQLELLDDTDGSWCVIYAWCAKQ